MNRLHDFSGFEMIDESGAVLAKCSTGEDLIKAHVKGYTRSDGTVVREHDDSRPAARQKSPISRSKPSVSSAHPQSDANEHNWDNLPDDDNPRHSLSQLSSKDLGRISKGDIDIRAYARATLAGRGMNEKGEWVGPKAASAAARSVSGDDDLLGELQQINTSILSAAAQGHLDLAKQAGATLAARGHDHGGKWIGFDAAKKLHSAK